MAPKFRPDLTEYRIYVEFLADKLNEQSLYKMSLTDVVKILIEKKVEELLPDIVVKRNRKVYQRLKF